MSATESGISRESILGKAPSKDEILGQIQSEGVKFINLQFTDVMGIVKSVTIPAHVFGHVIDGGQWIDGSSIAGFTRIAESDMYLEPDLSTFSVVPRGALYRQLERLAKLGYTYNVGPELEFFLFSKEGDQISPLPHDRGGY